MIESDQNQLISGTIGYGLITRDPLVADPGTLVSNQSLLPSGASCSHDRGKVFVGERRESTNAAVETKNDRERIAQK